MSRSPTGCAVCHRTIAKGEEWRCVLQGRKEMGETYRTAEKIWLCGGCATVIQATVFRSPERFADKDPLQEAAAQQVMVEMAAGRGAAWIMARELDRLEKDLGRMKVIGADIARVTVLLQSIAQWAGMDPDVFQRMLIEAQRGGM